MNWAAIAIKNNRVTIVFLTMLLLGGIAAYLSFPRSEDPEFTIRVAVIQTYFPGASPQKVEQLITEKLERKIQEMPQVEHIVSENRTGVSLITVEIKDKYKNLRPVWDDLKDKVEEVENDLPDGSTKPYVWDDFGDVFGIVLALQGEGFSYRELEDYADDIRARLLLIPDVAKVDFYGLQKEQIFIEISNARLKSLGIHPSELVDALKEQNIVLPAGSIEIGPEKIVVEPTGNFESVEDIRSATIPVSKTEVITLQDIATVKEGYLQPPQTLMRFDGKSAVAIAINMAEGGNIVRLGENVKAAMQELKEHLPVGLDLHIVAYQPTEVIRATNDFMINLIQAVIIVIFVMVLFLGVRTGLIVATLIPMTVLMTFLVMQFLGITLQRVSIASLIIALGLMVDCAIVVSEHILVYIEEGMDRVKAVVKTTNELRIPLLTSCLTTAVAFLPIALAKSGVGEYCLSLFQVVSIALLSSWFLALAIIPFFCYYFVDKTATGRLVKVFSDKKSKIVLLLIIFGFATFIAKLPLILVIVLAILFFRKFIFASQEKAEVKERFDTPIYQFYHRVLKFALLDRKKYLIGLICLFAFSMFCFGFIKQIFFPPSDRPQFFVHFWMPDGTNIYQTQEELTKLEDFLDGQKQIKSFASYIGEGGPRFFLSFSPEQNNDNYAYVLINTYTYEDVKNLIPKVKDFLRKNIPATNCSVRQLESASSVGYPIQVRVSGEDVSKLYDLSNQLQDIFSQNKGLEAINDNWGTKIKKLVIDVNQAKAKRLGISSENISYSVAAALDGLEITEYRRAEDVIPIVLRSDQNKEKMLEDIESFTVYSSGMGTNVPLSQVASTKLTWEPSKIFHRDRLRTVTVRADIKEGYLASEVLKVLKPKIEQAATKWPSGYSYEIAGEAEESREANEDIMEHLPLAVFIILLLMVMQFNSFRHTFIILSTVVMALIGVTWGLLLTNSAFGFMAFLGVISLAGIVINDAIVLLDRVRIESESKEIKQAVVTACFSHARPIILTSITTVGGLFPLALRGGEFWSPMAITIMSGLIFSTTLTLIFVPVLYSLCYKIRFEEVDFAKKKV